MKKVIINEEDNTTINLLNVPEHIPIFVKANGKLIGMLVKEFLGQWIIRTGADSGATGHYSTREKAMQSLIRLKCGRYEFFIEE